MGSATTWLQRANIGLLLVATFAVGTFGGAVLFGQGYQKLLAPSFSEFLSGQLERPATMDFQASWQSHLEEESVLWAWRGGVVGATVIAAGWIVAGIAAFRRRRDD